MKKTTVPTILVAVYGTLRTGNGNWHYYLNNNESEFLGEFQTQPKYTMYNLGAFPAVQESGDTSLTVEVFKVSENVKQSLDYLEGYDPESSRDSLYGLTTLETPFGEAVMYVMNNRKLNNNNIIKSGDWHKR